MSISNRQGPDDADLQQQWNTGDGNGRVFVIMNDVPLSSGNDPPQKQHLMYCNTPFNFPPSFFPQPYGYQQASSSNQTFQQPTFVRVSPPPQHQQLAPELMNAQSTNAFTPSVPMEHNHNQQRSEVPTIRTGSGPVPVPQRNQPQPVLMTNTATASTPISATTKRGRNDISDSSENNARARPRHYQTSRVFTSNNAPRIRTQRTSPNGLDPAYAHMPHPYQQEQSAQDSSTGIVRTNQQPEQHQPSLAAWRFATSRYPFAPFSVMFPQVVREKSVMEDLIKHARTSFQFELKTIAYRRAHAENNEYRLLIFVENSESFVFLFDRSNWPTSLVGCKFGVKSPSIPPQLSLVIPSVSLHVEWEEFVQEIKEKHTDIVNVIRLKNKAQQPVKAVKLEFKSVESRKEILDAGEISALYMKYRITEYFSQAKVLFCSNCQRLGHFRKNCPQQEEATCKVCGEKSSDLKEHQCSGVAKCVHCGGPHNSNDSNCRIVKDYRAALTRNLAGRTIPINANNRAAQSAQTDFPQLKPVQGQAPYSTAAAHRPSTNLDDPLSFKLDNILVQVGNEAKSTRTMIDELNEKLSRREEEMKQTVEILEKKVESMGIRYDNFLMQMLLVLSNVCKAVFNPTKAQTSEWSEVWQEQIKSLSDLLATSATPGQC